MSHRRLVLAVDREHVPDLYDDVVSYVMVLVVCARLVLGHDAPVRVSICLR